MLNRNLRIIWVKIHVTENNRFYMNLPISLYAFEEISECVMDLLALTCFFAPKEYGTSFHSVSVHTLREVLHSVIKMFESLTFDEPYDLVEVEAQNVKVSIKIR